MHNHVTIPRGTQATSYGTAVEAASHGHDLTDEQARAVAMAFASPGTSGMYLTSLSTCHPVALALLIEEIRRVRNIAEHADDRATLTALIDWALDTASAVTA